MNDEYDHSIIENKENTLFTSSLMYVLNNAHNNQNQSGTNYNENESLNYDNQQSIYEVLNKYAD
jgi:hypothetical protein